MSQMAPDYGPPSGRWLHIRRLLRPARRAAEWFALGTEERAIRRGADQEIEQAVNELRDRAGRVAADLTSEVRRLETDLAAVAERIDALRREVEEGFGARADMTIRELWRRLEFADSAQTTAIQRLERDVARLLGEQARAVPAVDPVERTAEPAPPAARGRPTPRTETIEKMRDYAGRFAAGRGRVLGLGGTLSEFLEIAVSWGIDAYGVDANPDSVAFCRGLGLDVVEDNPLTHLRATEDASLHGVFWAADTGTDTHADRGTMLHEIERALAPGGTLLIEANGDDSVVSDVRSAGFVVGEAPATSANGVIAARKP